VLLVVEAAGAPVVLVVVDEPPLVSKETHAALAATKVDDVRSMVERAAGPVLPAGMLTP